MLNQKKVENGFIIKSKAKEKCNSSHCIAFGSEFNEKFQKNWIFFSRSPLRHLISNSVGSSILCSAAINFNTSLAAAVQSKRLHNGVKTILLCQNYFIVSKLFYCVKTTLLCQNYFILSNHGYSKGAPNNHLLFTLKNKAYFDPKGVHS